MFLRSCEMAKSNNLLLRTPDNYLAEHLNDGG